MIFWIIGPISQNMYLWKIDEMFAGNKLTIFKGTMSGCRFFRGKASSEIQINLFCPFVFLTSVQFSFFLAMDVFACLAIALLSFTIMTIISVILLTCQFRYLIFSLLFVRLRCLFDPFVLCLCLFVSLCVSCF